MSGRHVAVSLAASICALAALLGLVASCSVPPVREALLAASIDAAASAGSDCPRAIRAAAQSDAQRQFLCRLDGLENRITHQPLVAGNRVELLVDGPATHAAQLAAIARARHHIHLAAYILDDDEVGARYRDALIERARAGVRVRVMFDSVGGLTVGRAYREALAGAGIEVHEYAPINPLEEPELWRVSRRNHRKLLVVDGRVAFTGGIGISNTYSTSPVKASTREAVETGWRDTHVRITGPAVAEFQRLFVDDWQREVAAIPPDPGYFPELAPRGDELVRAIARQGEDLSELVLNPVARLLRRVRPHPADHAIYASYLAALSESRRRVWITQAYFAPNPEFLDALARAARRGIDVRLLVPANSDVGLLLYASRAQYAPLLEAGVRIFEYEGTVLHAKTAVVDGVWSTVGSSNLDYRSFIHNDEANAIIVGRSFAREMEAMFQDDLARSREVELAAWRERPVRERLMQALAGALKYWI
jgi:cardiolipin synthase